VTRAGWALLLAVAGAACGVKAPPRAAGSADAAPPNDLFRPTRDPGPVPPEPILVGPLKPGDPAAGTGEPAAAPDGAPAAPPAPPTPGPEPTR
jgi:hypothetical protein